MPLSWNEIKNRALGFSRKWDGEASERAEAQSFWNDFFEVFGISRKRVAVFEKNVTLTRKNEKLKRGRIDAFWKGVLLIEHKSEGVNLERAFEQATDYFDGLAERDLPRYILVSDFAQFKLYDLEADTQVSFKLADLHKQVKHFGFIAGYRTQEIKPQDPVNIKAAEQMGKLHDQLTASGYSGHALELLLVRLLFCLFADDTGIFQPAQSLRMWLDERTAPDGSDLGPQLAQLFQVLDQASEKRQKNLDEQLNAFPHVNGKLFQEMLPMASFDAKMRDTLLDCCKLDWAAISPAIFGALFQSIMDDKARRNLGAHYTSEENIIKLIKPLFLDELWLEFNKIKGNRNKLFDFQKKLRTLTFFDPACGCGNFLVITYRELCMLELEVLRSFRVLDPRGQEMLRFTQVDVDQFYGIEIEEFPAQIAQVALWLIDHQMNMLFSEEFGIYFARIPLVTTPHIVHDNALRIDWNDVLPAERCSYVMGNPPFVGHQWRDAEQMKDMESIWGIGGRFGRLDYVTCWHRLAVNYMQINSAIKAAFVSTNSICQGEQVGILWSYMLGKGAIIHFAHRTFSWSNEARGNAAVHCVIVGFALRETENKAIFEYEEINGEPHAVPASNINPYLVDGPNVILPSRTEPPHGLPQLIQGSKPADGRHLILSEVDKIDLLKVEPATKKWLRP
jgi:N-6 DNA Methylase